MEVLGYSHMYGFGVEGRLGGSLALSHVTILRTD